jgi:thiamine biosynthesis lipoprotein
MTLLTRRRVISIIAGCLTVPAPAAAAEVWRGRAMGAEARVALAQAGGRSTFQQFNAIEAIIAGVERQFSLHAPSDLSRLNATGVLRNPTKAMRDVLALVSQVHAATGGAFDPTVQPLWQALAKGEDATRARTLVGWDRVLISADGIALPAGVQLTLNGIAQGYCADQVVSFLRREGFEHVLIDTGEIAAIGVQPDGALWPVVLAGPEGRPIGQAALADRALATSSPFSLRLTGGAPHILGPRDQPPLWSTVSISAPSAAVADALSTAACLLSIEQITHALVQFPGARLEAIA